MYLYHYAAPWFEYATWAAEHASPAAAAAVYQRALKALPTSTPLHYAYAELEELRGYTAAAKGVYRSLLDREETASALVHIQVRKPAQQSAHFGCPSSDWCSVYLLSWSRCYPHAATGDPGRVLALPPVLLIGTDP
jgi:hypothetical protein